MAEQVTTPQAAVAPTPSVLPNTSANVQNFLQSYQPTAQQVYSPTNVQQAIIKPAAAPNMADPMGLYNYYMNTPEVTAAQKSYQDIQNKLSQFDIQAQQAQLGLENQTVSLNVIRGEQAQLGQQVATTRQGLANQALVAQSAMEAARQTAQDKLNLALQQRSELTQLITANPGAGISYADTVESASKKINKYQEQVAKDEYKQQLKQVAMQLGIKTKGSAKQIEKRLRKYYKSQKDYEQQIQQLELAAKQKSLRGGSGRANELSATAQAYQKFGGDWGKTAEYLANQGYDVSSGSTIDNELRRRNGLPPITTASTKPATQAQYTVAGYADRAIQSSNIINNLESTGSALTGIVAGQGWFPNVLKSSDRQQLEQAQRNFVNALLRKESGAAISQSEFENAAKQYFPQPGDSMQVMEQKKKNRETVIQNLQQAAGSAYSGVQLGEQDINDILSQFSL